MKFKNIGTRLMTGVYGYQFKIGEIVEVDDDVLCAKFKNYSWLKEVQDAVRQKEEKTTEEEEERLGQELTGLDRAELKVIADKLGIQYAPNVWTDRLIRMIQEHGDY